MIYNVTHLTRYSYSSPVTNNHSKVYLEPRDLGCQTCQEHNLEIKPAPDMSYRNHDYFDNKVTYFTVHAPHKEFSVMSSNRIEVRPRFNPTPSSTPSWESARDDVATLRSPESLDAFQFTRSSCYIERADFLRKYAEPMFPKGRPALEGAMALCDSIHKEFEYKPASTDITTTLESVMKQKAGVCQDFAHLMIGALRSIGMAARYVSGYLRTIPPKGKPRLRGVDASHAWVSLYLPGHGWVDIDPTNNIMCQTDHITLAYGRDFDDVSPVRGIVLGGADQMSTVSVDVDLVDPQDNYFL